MLLILFFSYSSRHMSACSSFQALIECPSGCICDQLTNCKTDELRLNSLQEVELTDLKGAEYEATFVKQLFSWATKLQKMRITLAYLVSESRVNEFHQRLLGLFGPEVHVEYYMRDSPRMHPSHLL
jgi:hypothetical protein